MLALMLAASLIVLQAALILALFALSAIMAYFHF